MTCAFPGVVHPVAHLLDHGQLIPKALFKCSELGLQLRLRISKGVLSLPAFGARFQRVKTQVYSPTDHKHTHNHKSK